MTGFSDLLVEVYVEANEPWHDGLRRAYDAAICEFTGTSLEKLQESWRGVDVEDFYAGWDAQANLEGGLAYDDLLLPTPGYVGWGVGAHEDADGPVFRGTDAAQRFADMLRRHIGPLATVGQHTLS